MKATYRVLAYLIPVIVALQASFIAMGTFGLGSWVEDGNDFTKNILENGGARGDVGFALHSFGAIAAAVVGLLLLIISFFAKIEGGIRAALFVFLDVVLQWVLAFVSFGVWTIGILHGLNAFLLFGLGLMAAGAATRSIKGTAATTSAPTSTTTV
jgi:uncharacterized membrane protein (Fun14 family)